MSELASIERSKVTMLPPLVKPVYGTPWRWLLRKPLYFQITFRFEVAP